MIQLKNLVSSISSVQIVPESESTREMTLVYPGLVVTCGYYNLPRPHDIPGVVTVSTSKAESRRHPGTSEAGVNVKHPTSQCL